MLIDRFLSTMNIALQPHQHLHGLYQGWMTCFEAYAAAQITGEFILPNDANAAECRKIGLQEHAQTTRQIASLRLAAQRESQISRRVQLNNEIKRLEQTLATLTSTLNLKGEPSRP